jgi:hypothetical protein
MICDQTKQLDIRSFAGRTPRFLSFGGERVGTAWTATNFGGRRQWFLCPTCERQCAIIYQIDNGPLWGCRTCMKGRYLSEHYSPHARKMLKAKKTRRKMGQEQPSIDLPFPGPPLGMHSKTYRRIRSEAPQNELEIHRERLELLRKGLLQLQRRTGWS